MLSNFQSSTMSALIRFPQHVCIEDVRADHVDAFEKITALAGCTYPFKTRKDRNVVGRTTVYS
jgi:hypothetical protein